MTNCTGEHEWEWMYMRSGTGGKYPRCECGATLSTEEHLARLNATERLSAGCFNCKKTIQETYLKQFPSGDYTCRDCDIAFADTLEGK